ncbi:hypothetical protein EGH21_00960 [Halomicroarcula sp. F13]|uniref:DUF1102 domain-containing protein n=1 Tax=Haloarcula rubra TaxID=2487747 RepID=A0AAW4PKM9_9EURY|nr:hypothetical protein [Halomicroarcula rubra]MBX0321588.1 hypothetical protein [Halomicroarcula rubra]
MMVEVSTLEANVGDVIGRTGVHKEHKTMQRRKFLIGMGSLAAGSAAAIGTGAFESANATRGVSVSLAADANAYLKLTADDEYVTNDSGTGTLTVDLGGPTTDEGGQGFNDNAVTVVNTINIQNQGGNQKTVNIDLVDNTGSGIQAALNGDPTLGPGGSVSDAVQFTVDTKNANPENSGGNIVIKAQEV